MTVSLTTKFIQGVSNSEPDYADYFACCHTNGVDATRLNKLVVSAQDPASKKVAIATGTVLINGYMATLATIGELPVIGAVADYPHATLDRIDTVVVELTATPPATVEIKVVKGTAAASPVPTALTRNTTTWQIPLAYITVTHGVTSIAADKIVDGRKDLAGMGFTLNLSEGGLTIPAGLKLRWKAPCSCEILGYECVASPSGSMVWDIKKFTYATFPTSTSICASAKPTITSAQKVRDYTLAGWTLTLEPGDWLEFYVDSCTSITNADFAIDIVRRSQ